MPNLNISSRVYMIYGIVYFNTHVYTRKFRIAFDELILWRAFKVSEEKKAKQKSLWSWEKSLLEPLPNKVGSQIHLRLSWYPMVPSIYVNGTHYFLLDTVYQQKAHPVMPFLQVTVQFWPTIYFLLYVGYFFYLGDSIVKYTSHLKSGSLPVVGRLFYFSILIFMIFNR